MIKTLSGSNEYEIHREVQKIIKQFGESASSNSVSRFDSENLDLSKIKDSLSGMSLFSEKTLVIVKDLSQDKSLHEKFIDLLENIPEDSDLLIIETSLDNRSKYAKYLKENTNFIIKDELPQAGLVTWIIETVKHFGGSISRPNAQYLVDFVGNDQWLLSNELQKLAQSGKEINRELIEQLCEPQITENIFQLLDEVGNNNRQKSLDLYDKLRAQRIEPHYILSMIIWSLHNMLIVKQARDKIDSQIAQDSKMSPYVITKTRQSVRDITQHQLAQMIEYTAMTDLKLKTSPVDADDALKNLILNLSAI